GLGGRTALALRPVPLRRAIGAVGEEPAPFGHRGRGAAGQERVEGARLGPALVVAGLQDGAVRGRGRGEARGILGEDPGPRRSQGGALLTTELLAPEEHLGLGEEAILRARPRRRR